MSFEITLSARVAIEHTSNTGVHRYVGLTEPEGLATIYYRIDPFQSLKINNRLSARFQFEHLR